MIVFGPACIDSSRKISFLMSIFSEAASITNWTSRNSIEFEFERCVTLIGADSRDHVERSGLRRLRIGWKRRLSFRRRNFWSWTLPFVDQAPRCLEQLLS